MQAKLVIPCSLPNLNDYINEERRSRYHGAKLKQKTQELVCWYIRQQLRGVSFSTPVTVHYAWYEKDKRRDLDNISSFGRKIIQDALVVSHVLQNDGWKNIAGFTDCFLVDSKKPRVEVTICTKEENMEHPEITMALATGYPHPVQEPYHCEYCGRAMFPGDECYQINGELICERCIQNYRFELEEA